MSLYGRILQTEQIPKNKETLRALILSLPFGKTEQDRLLGIQNERTLRESLAAWMALWNLVEYLSLPSPTIVSRSPYGKPYFETDSLPDFSLSHTDSFSVAVINTDGPIGVDLEGFCREDSFEKISHRFFSESEQTRLKKSDKPHEDFLKLWTKKEALAKLTGKGLSSIVRKEQDIFGSSFQAFRIQTATDASYLTVATHQPTDPIQWVDLAKEISIYELQN